MGGLTTGPTELDHAIEVALLSLSCEAADVTERVDNKLVDSGSPYDIISESIAAMPPDSQGEAPPVRLNTANGIITAHRCLNAVYPMLGEEESVAYILRQTPAANLYRKKMHEGRLQLCLGGWSSASVVDA